MHRVIIETQPDATALISGRATDYVAQAIALSITQPDTIRADLTQAGAYVIVTEFEHMNSLERHHAVANDLLNAVTALGMYAVRVVATRTATRAAEGLLAGGLLSGLGATATQKTEWRPWIVAIGGVVGSLVGNAVEKEVEIFVWRRDQAGYWYETPQAQRQQQWGWQG